MIAVALGAEEIAGAALQSGQKPVVPHRLLQYGGVELPAARSSPRAEMRARLKLIHELHHRMIVGKETREHGTANIRRMRTRQDRILGFDHTADRNRGDPM